MGLMPPGSGKSIYTSVCFPTYYLGRFPHSRVIVTGYGSDLPKKQGRWARTIVKSPLFKRIFSCELSDESGAVDEWSLTNGSEWYARGINAGITGQRADGIVWDDLMRGREDADSKTMRDKTWAAYMDDLMSRKKNEASWEVGINTRWHEDDPPGRILPANYNGESGWLKGQDGNDWYVVCLPAEAEREDDPLGRQRGDLLWPGYWSEKHFAPFRLNVRTWSSLYQQRPAPETGNFFQASWLRPHGDGTNTPTPDLSTLHIYGASDYACTDEGGNYTVHVVAGVDANHNIFLLDLWRGRTATDQWIEVFCNLCRDYKPLGWAEEKGQIMSGVGPFLHRRMVERSIYVARAQFPTRGDKQIRAQSIRGRMAMGKFYVPTTKSWYSELRHELLTFPAGKTDDQVDALGLLGQVLDKMVGGYSSDDVDTTPKVLSTNPNECTVTLGDMFEMNERHAERKRGLRIR